MREVAREGRDARFTVLLHHVYPDRLRAACWAIRPKAAPGVDGVRGSTYGQDLEASLLDLHDRVHRGSYRAGPSRGAYIERTDGRLRPLGIATLEDIRNDDIAPHWPLGNGGWGVRPGVGGHRGRHGREAGRTCRFVMVTPRLYCLMCVLELASLLVLLTNVAATHIDAVAAFVGPVHGVAYLIVATSTPISRDARPERGFLRLSQASALHRPS